MIYDVGYCALLLKEQSSYVARIAVIAHVTLEGKGVYRKRIKLCE